MRKVFLIFLLITTGCATSYQPKGFSGGYTDRKVGKNKFMVTFSGNGYTSRSKVESYAYRRAQELCVENGYDEYELLNQQGHDSESALGGDQVNCSGYGNNVSCSQSPKYNVSRSSITLLFSCVKNTTNGDASQGNVAH